LADYIIIDTYSALQSDRLTRSALKLADITFRLCSSDLKAISFFKGVMPLMIEKSFNIEKQIKVLSKSKEDSPKAIIKNHYGEIKYNLPFTSELESQYEEGFLFEKLVLKESKEYVENFNEIIHLITGEDIIESHKKKSMRVLKTLKSREEKSKKSEGNISEQVKEKNDVSSKKPNEKSNFKLPKLPKIKLRKKKEGFDE
jgi:cellulose biosynthesis protein BcsQ